MTSNLASDKLLDELHERAEAFMREAAILGLSVIVVFVKQVGDDHDPNRRRTYVCTAASLSQCDDIATLLELEAHRIRREHAETQPCPKCQIQHLGSA